MFLKVQIVSHGHIIHIMTKFAIFSATTNEVLV